MDKNIVSFNDFYGIIRQKCREIRHKNPIKTLSLFENPLFKFFR